MGSTIWLLSESKLEEGDSWDHSAMLQALDELDLLSVSMNVPTISSFMGLPEYGGNLSWKSHRKRASWFDPQAAIRTFEVLRVHIAANPEAVSIPHQAFTGADFRELLLEELDDCLGKVKTFAEMGDRFHACIVA